MTKLGSVPEFSRKETRMPELQTGTAAPDFTLGAHNTDQKISLSSFRGQPTVVSFLPMAFTGG
jgi:peroxiredoxin